MITSWILTLMFICPVGEEFEFREKKIPGVTLDKMPALIKSETMSGCNSTLGMLTLRPETIEYRNQ